MSFPCLLRGNRDELAQSGWAAVGKQSYEVEGQLAGGPASVSTWLLQASPFPSLGLSFPHLYNEEASRRFFKRKEGHRDKAGKGEERSRLTEVCLILPEVPR